MKSNNKFAIVAGHKETAAAAQEVLNDGGNAYDAAIAALLVAFVAEPCMASAGGGGFANVYTKEKKSYLFDFFCQTPRQKRRVKDLNFYPVDVDFGGAVERFFIGRAAIGTPGSIAGIFAIHKALGSVPMRYLVQPAIAAAKQGVRINEFQHLDFKLLEKILREDPKAKNVFFENALLKSVGDYIVMPEFVNFLDYLWREGKDAFYEGEIAAKIVADQETNGGYITKADLSNYKVEIRKPLYFDYHKNKVLTNHLPSIGGPLTALILKGLENNFNNKKQFDKTHLKQWYHVFSEIEKIGITQNALKNALLEQSISVNNNISITPDKRGSTSHLSILDQWDNAISLTVSNGEGSGVFIEGTNIQLNNMLGEASLIPEGFHRWPTDTRLASMMSPTIVLDHQQKIKMVLGSGGASRIPAAIAQVLQNVLDFDMDLASAIDAPRVYLGEGVFQIEKGFAETLNAKNISHKIKNWTEQSLFFGGVNAILKNKKGLHAVGDARRDGVALEG